MAPARGRAFQAFFRHAEMRKQRVVNHADLRAVAVGDDDVVAFSNHVNDAGCSVLYELKLLLGRIAQALPPSAMTIRFPSDLM